MKVALIGTGLMGFPMAEKLLESKYELVVYNRTRQKADPLAGRGAVVAGTPQDALAAAETIVIMLSGAPAIEELFFKDGTADFSGKTVIQMSTIAPDESRDLARRIEKAGGEYLECPVLGSTPQVRDRKLILMVGATAGQFKKWEGFLKNFGPEPRLVGEVGQAAALKLAMNQFIASHACTFSLSLALVRHSGVDVDTFMSILRTSALFAPMFDNKLPTILNKSYDDPHFPAKHMLKDVDLFLRTAKDFGLHDDHLLGVRSLIEETLKQGRADQDYSSLYEAVDPADQRSHG